MGPTASGKTGVAIDLAGHLDTEIISADARQCYREMKIGVARPTEDELAQVKHHFIASHSIEEEVNAAVFERYALEKATAVFRAKDVVVMTGGTGLYIRSFCRGLDEMPEVSESLKQELQLEYEQKGLEWIQARINTLDPEYALAGEMMNPQRILRALGVVLSSGQSILHFQKGKTAQRPFAIQKYAIQMDRSLLYERINERVDLMMEQGLLQEAEGLYPQRHLKALQTVGYTELFRYMDGELDLNEAIRLIKQNTRHYAKRQMTWLRKEEGIQWISSGQEILG